MSALYAATLSAFKTQGWHYREVQGMEVIESEFEALMVALRLCSIVSSMIIILFLDDFSRDQLAEIIESERKVPRIKRDDFTIRIDVAYKFCCRLDSIFGIFPPCWSRNGSPFLRSWIIPFNVGSVCPGFDQFGMLPRAFLDFLTNIFCWDD